MEPNVQKTLWADYLKKNCLSGMAYNLISGVDDINIIWTKLTKVYGNTQLLLQNKIGSLGKFSNLEKLRDDERIAFTLSSILNVMEDLSKLAVEFDLEAELYHGGGLQKILDLLGKRRERNFIASAAKESLRNRQRWKKLVEFLEKELQEREAYILNEKVKTCLNLDTTQRNRDSDNEKPKFDSRNFLLEILVKKTIKSVFVIFAVNQKCMLIVLIQMANLSSSMSHVRLSSK